MTSRRHSNQLLHRLPATERRRIEAGAEQVALRAGSVLCHSHQPITRVCFPHTGIFSLMATAGRDAFVHVAFVGRETMFGLPLALGHTSSPLHAEVHTSGDAVMIEAAVFVSMLAQCPALRRSLFTHAHALVAQVSQTAACNALHSASARLARWLLTASDHHHSQTLAITQERLAQHLGLLRAAVNRAAGDFQQQGLIDCDRGVIQIRRREDLRACACTCYDVMHRIHRSYSLAEGAGAGKVG